jgi:uncharacterized membrane protein YjgN (DUF898 family)
MQDQQTPTAPGAAPKAIEFRGVDADFRGLVTSGALLELVTFGFYRFWLATNIRRHLWSRTFFAGDSLEYLGTGRELLIGFLFALAILSPVYLLYFLLGVEAERQYAFASLPLGVFFLAFTQFALYRARRYRLHRTAWRGLRFGMDGSGWLYAFWAVLWWAFAGLTLGLAYPWAQAALERRKMKHTHYGEAAGRFVGTGWEFFKRGWWLWAVPMALFVVIAAAAGAAEADAKDGSLGGLGGLGVLGAVLLIFAYLAAPFVYAAYKAIQWKWWLEGLRVGEARAMSSLRLSAFFGNIWAYIGMNVAVLFVGAILFGIVMFALDLNGVPLETASAEGKTPSFVLILAVVPVYLGVMLAFGVLWRIYFIQRVWKIVVSSLTLYDLEGLEHVASRPGTANALGEGFADNLDVVGF